MALLNSLLVTGESRLLNKLYINDMAVDGNIETEGTLNVGKNTRSNAKIYLYNRLIIDGTGTDNWLRINASSGPPFAGGVYFGSSGVRTDGSLHVGASGAYLSANSSAFTVSVPSTFTYPENSGYALTVSGKANIGTVNITTANTNNISNSGNIYNKNGRIETDSIQSNKWDITTIQNLGGTFIVAPTIIITEGSTVSISSVTGSTLVGTIKDTTNITSDSFGGHTWSASSRIKITGKLTSGNNSYVLGTCDGTLTAKMNTTANTINFSVTCNASALPPAGTYTMSGGTVMCYNIGGAHKVGIEIAAYQTDKYTYIDIYDGSNGIKPVARLGKLDSLSTDAYGNIQIADTNMSGYGIYTNNGYYKGVIVANGGKIGGYSIGATNLTKGSTQNASGSFWLTPEGISSTMSSLNSSALSWSMTVGQYFGITTTGALYSVSGKIGNWNISDNNLYIGTWGTDSSAMLCTGTSTSRSIGGSNTISGWVFTAGANFGVTKSGALYANSATIAGNISATSGSIAGWTIGNGYITTNTNRTTYNSTSYTGMTMTASGIGAYASNTAYFNLSASGGLTAVGATISGTITADSGTIGGWTANSSYGLYTNNKTSATSTNTGILIQKDGAIYAGAYDSTSGVASCPFQVNSSGELVARSGRIGKFSLTNTYLITGSGSTAAGMGGNQAFFAGSDTSNSAPFRVGYDGTFVATNATITGTINASGGGIGGFEITSTAIKTDGVDTSSAVTNSVTLSSANFSRNISGHNRDDWRFAIAGSFGVTNTGTLYAAGAYISGEIKAEEGYFGGEYGFYISNRTICSYNHTVDDTYPYSIALSTYPFTRYIGGYARDYLVFAIGDSFAVDSEGVLIASGADITGNITANSLTIGRNATISGLKLGGVNLLKNSNDLTKWGKESGIVVEYDSTVGMYKITDTSHNSSYYGIYQDITVEPSTTYTASIDAKSGTNTMKLGVQSYDSSASWPQQNIRTSTSTKNRITYTFTTGSSHTVARFYIFMNPTETNQYCYAYHPQLEKGMVATDWSPSSEDTDVHKYVTDIDSNHGITIKPIDSSGNDYLELNSTAISIYRNNKKMMAINDSTLYFYDASGTDTSNVTAQFSSLGAVIGKTGSNNVVIDSNGMTIKNNGTTYANFSSTATIGQTSSKNVYISGNGIDFRQGTTTTLAHFGYDLINGESDSINLPYYDLGNRFSTIEAAYSASRTYKIGDMVKYNNKYYVCKENITTPEAWNSSHWKSTIGGYSMTQGTNNLAAGYASFAGGWSTSAIGSGSHTEGWDTIASGNQSHSEGRDTLASGEYSHAEGYNTQALHFGSHAGGGGTRTSRSYQTVIGHDNAANSDALFIVGNGLSTSVTSNAFWVTNNGTVYACGNDTGTKNEAQIGAKQGAGQIYLYSQIGSGNYTNRGVYTFNSSNSGKTVYTIDTNNNITFYGSLSDLKRKNIIKDFNWKIDDFINGLKPIAYTVKNPDGNDGKRIHMGFGAQDVKKLSEDLSLGDLSLYKAQLIQRNEDGSTDEVYYDGHDESDENLSWTLDYVEFIPMLTMEIQRLMKRVDELEEKLELYEKHGDQ